MSEKELADAMSAAAKAATEACVAQGYSRGDKVTIASAKRAAEEVYAASGRQYEPSVPRLIDQPRRDEDTWQERKDLA